MLSFRVPGATSEKFVLAIVLLDAFLHGQGHDQPIEASPQQVRCAAHSGRNNVRMSGLSGVAVVRRPGSEGQRVAHIRKFAHGSASTAPCAEAAHGSASTAPVWKQRRVARRWGRHPALRRGRSRRSPGHLGPPSQCSAPPTAARELNTAVLRREGDHALDGPVHRDRADAVGRKAPAPRRRGQLQELQ